MLNIKRKIIFIRTSTIEQTPAFVKEPFLNIHENALIEIYTEIFRNLNKHACEKNPVVISWKEEDNSYVLIIRNKKKDEKNSDNRIKTKNGYETWKRYFDLYRIKFDPKDIGEENFQLTVTFNK